MALDNSLDCGQTYTSAFERLLRMEALENTKQLILILHVKTNSVVFNKYDHLARRVIQRIDFYLGVFGAISPIASFTSCSRWMVVFCGSARPIREKARRSSTRLPIRSAASKIILMWCRLLSSRTGP